MIDSHESIKGLAQPGQFCQAQTTGSLKDDVLTMAKLYNLAHTWIMHQLQADAKGRKESAQAAA